LASVMRKWTFGYYT